MYNIENDLLKIAVRPYGAELTSVFDKKKNIEHLWQADKKFWAWHAPVLFPVVGRCLNDEIVVNGIKYPMQKHGFARKSEFTLLSQSAAHITFSLVNSADTLMQYPYRFQFLITYSLQQNTLQVNYEVHNTDTQPIYFQLGGHPAFAVPFFNKETYADYFLEFTETENCHRHFIDENGFFNGATEPVIEYGSKILLRPDLFKDDALIFKNLKSKEVTIKSNNHSHTLSVNYHSFNYLGLWAKENAPYVCIEPWLGCADTSGEPVEFAIKEGIQTLNPAEKFQAGFSVCIH